MGSKRALYLSYDGMTDPLGQGQVLSYLQGLAAAGWSICLISFEKKDRYAKSGESIRGICHKSGIEWHPMIYTKKPPVFSTAYDIMRMWQKAKRLHLAEPFTIVHCRSYIASLVGLRLKRKYGIKFIFDMRGFWIDEKIESGEWNQKKFIYKKVIDFLRSKEKQFYIHADAIVTLTFAAKNVVAGLGDYAAKTHVIPTCVNLAVFKPYSKDVRTAIRLRAGISGESFVLIYSGGYGGNYDIDFLLSVYNRIRTIHQDTCLLILSKDGNTGIPESERRPDIKSFSLPYSEVSDFLMAGDMGVINYKHSFSVAGRSPTKLGEYWASGLPAVAPIGIGDLEFLFNKYKDSGILFTPASFPDDLAHIQQVSKESLRQYATDFFGLEKGVLNYQAVYENLASNV